MSNPTSVLDTILDSDENPTKGNLTIKTLSVGRYALLELVKSPFLDGSEFTAYTMIPTMYIMTHEMSDLKGFNSKNIDGLIEKSLEWGDNVLPQELSTFADKLVEMMYTVNKVAPDPASSGKGDKSGEATGG